MKHSVRVQVKQLKSPTENRVLRFIGSNETEDRDGDVIRANGWQLENYKKNPVFLWAHDYTVPPIGRALDVRVVNNQLIFDIEFPVKGVYPLADTVYELYKGGFMKATSVGFQGKEFEPRQGGGTLYKKQELLELSAVPVPANPEALQLAKSKGLVTSATEKFFSDDEIIIEIVDDEIEIEGVRSADELRSTIHDAVQDTLNRVTGKVLTRRD